MFFNIDTLYEYLKHLKFTVAIKLKNTFIWIITAAFMPPITRENQGMKSL